MKRTYISLLVIIAFAFVACDKESGGTEYDFSNSLPSYITLTDAQSRIPDTIDVVSGDEIPVTFTMRTGQSKVVTVTYNVTGGFELANQTVDIERYKTNKDVIVAVPGDAEPGSLAAINLVSAVKSDGSALTIGRYNDPSIEKVILRIVEP